MNATTESLDNSSTGQENVQHKPAQLDSSLVEASGTYIRSLSSKNVCAQFIDAMKIWFNIPDSTITVFKEVNQEVHNAALILDDIQDGSSLRRGSKATHLVFGQAQALNGAFYLFTKTTHSLNALNNPALMNIWLEEIEKQFIGQSWDVKWRDNAHCPTEEEYLSMVDLKTGIVFKRILRLMQAADTDESAPSKAADFDRLSQLMGRWYQVRDDYMNLEGAEYTKTKGFCEDLDEGKISYLVVRCCLSSEVNRDTIMGIFREKQGNSLPMESKLQILGLMQTAGVFQATYEMVVRLGKEIEEEIGQLEGHFGKPNTVLRLIVSKLGGVPAPSNKY